jgi:isopentenyl-diphosphate delta-isomerase type 1
MRHGKEKALSEELFEIVNQQGEVIGIAPRTQVHGNPDLLHRVVHVLVFNAGDELLLQKRSLQKDVAPGKWDTSVGGHMAPGETVEAAAIREMEEELGLPPDNLTRLYTYTHSNSYESEMVVTFRTLHNGPFTCNPVEIDEIRFWRIDEIRQQLGRGLFSDNFEDEFRHYLR